MLKTVSLALGVLLLIGAILLAFVVVPSMKVFPEDVDVVRQYNVKYLTLLDPASMQFIRFAEGENPDLHIDRHVKVEEVDGNNTLVLESQTLFNGDQTLTALVKHHALDRKTLEFLDEIPADWADAEGIWQRQGLVIGWGIGAEPKDYVGWSDDYRATTPMVYSNEEEHGGMNTLHFTSSSEPKLIDPAHVAFLNLPTELTITSLRELAAGMKLDDPELQRTVQSLLPIVIGSAVTEVYGPPAEGEEQAVPLVYYYSYEADYWVDPTTGVLIDTRKHEKRGVTFPTEIMDNVKATLEGMNRDPSRLDAVLPLTVNEFEYQTTDASVSEAREEAEDAAGTINLFGMYVPIALAVVGVLLLGFGVFSKKAA